MRTFKAGHKSGSKTKLLWQDPEYREHMRQAHLGQTAWNKGIKTGLVPKTAFKKGRKPTENWYKIMTGKYDEKSHSWKGNKVGYGQLHTWVRNHLGRANKCENPNCIYPRKMLGRNKIMIAPSGFEWANISGEYKRELSDWHQLCLSCNRNDGIKIAERFNI